MGSTLRASVATAFQEVTGKGEVNGEFSFESSIPVGAGMSSSTADAVAVIRAIASYHGIDCSTDLIECILHKIERSDPVFIDKHCLYSSEGHYVLAEFDSRQHYWAMWSTSPVETPTADFPRGLLMQHYNRHLKDYEQSRKLVLESLADGDVVGLAQQATRSARLAQAYLYDPIIDLCVDRMDSIGALGVVRAHTGTVRALLFHAQQTSIDVGEAEAVLGADGTPVSRGWVGLW